MATSPMPTATSGGANDTQRRRKRKPLESDDLYGDDDGTYAACQSCRKRKAKCSRQQPCRQCVRLQVQCIYDEKRQKPGIRTGAVEALSQRLNTLEQMFIGQGLLLRPLLEASRTLPNLSPTDKGTLAEQSESLRRHFATISAKQQARHETSELESAGQAGSSPVASTPTVGKVHELPKQPALPSSEVLARLVDKYFQEIHLWVPVLHESSFRAKIEDPDQRDTVSTILYAIANVCLPTEESDYALACRNLVMLRSMDAFSVQNLQALVIIAFKIIGSGKGPAAWSVVGSMARTVEHLQLSVEDDDKGNTAMAGLSLIQRVKFLKPADTWIEAEERRRIFWVVFLMDRFCSVATGWNNSITGADVQRRLPCEGALWKAGSPVTTPYFGIAQRSATADSIVDAAMSNEDDRADQLDIYNIGGLAFCIEATESLNLVTTFFLRQPVDFSKSRELQIWLLKFRELDMRLVKWRLFLPPRWSDASAPNTDGIMDANLSLAHMTHNAAVIQLHQVIAYPSAHWKPWAIALPSDTSADTCVTAANEIRTTAEHYLRGCSSVVNPQFSFCLFVAGRALLAHTANKRTAVPAVFDEIVECLCQISERWIRSAGGQKDNLASRFALRLQKTRIEITRGDAHQHHSLLDIRRPVYSEDSRPVSRRSSQQEKSRDDAEVNLFASGAFNNFSPDSMSLAFPPMPPSLQQHSDYGWSGQEVALQPYVADDVLDGSIIDASETDAMNAISGIFDSSFQEMSRVSIYNG